MYTSTMATITAVNTNSINVQIDTSLIELKDVPIITLQGGGYYLQFPISVGDQCMLIFTRDSNDNWLGGGDDLIYSTNFDINNSFALVGINNNNNLIDIVDYTNLVIDKIKIQNESGELITVLSDVLEQLETLTSTLSSESTLSGTATYTTVNTSLTALKATLDTFKV